MNPIYPSSLTYPNHHSESVFSVANAKGITSFVLDKFLMRL